MVTFARGEYEGRETGSDPKVVFLDLKLPKVDGLEVLREMKADEAGTAGDQEAHGQGRGRPTLS